MSHFGRSGPPDISDTFSLLVLNITFRTTADNLFPLFDKYGKVLMYLYLAIEGLENREVLPLCGINMLMRHKRQLISLMGKLWTGERLWCNLPSMVPMRSEFRMGG